MTGSGPRRDETSVDDSSAPKSAGLLPGGLVNVAVRGWDWFGIVQMPGFASDDRALRRSINGWHELAVNALLSLAVIHAVAALYHQLVRGDDLLKRMWFARRNMS